MASQYDIVTFIDDHILIIGTLGAVVFLYITYIIFKMTVKNLNDNSTVEEIQFLAKLNKKENKPQQKALKKKNEKRGNKKQRRTPVFKHGSSERQYALAFPKFIIDYIISNPKSPEQWKKLVQTCKLWFDKNPIVVIPCLHFDGWGGEAWKTCSGDYCHDSEDQEIFIVYSPIKLWITENLEVEKAALSQSLIPHLFKCDVQNLYLAFDILSSHELSLLTANVVTAYFCRIHDSNKNRRNFLLEEIMENLPATLETIEFMFYDENITPDTFKKLSKMEHVRKLRQMNLHGTLSSFFDFDELFKFMIENKQIRFVVQCIHLSPTEEYMTAVDNFAEKIQNEDYSIQQCPQIYFNRVILVGHH